VLAGTACRLTRCRGGGNWPWRWVALAGRVGGCRAPHVRGRGARGKGARGGGTHDRAGAGVVCKGEGCAEVRRAASRQGWQRSQGMSHHACRFDAEYAEFGLVHDRGVSLQRQCVHPMSSSLPFWCGHGLQADSIWWRGYMVPWPYRWLLFLY